MTVKWQVQQLINSQGSEDKTYTVHSITCEQANDNDFYQAINVSIDKAVDLLSVAVSDESRYLLFEWNADDTSLSIIVTDDSKEQDADVIVRCAFLEQDADKVKYAIKDYLTTCTAFFNYSLIAIFSRDGRKLTELL